MSAAAILADSANIGMITCAAIDTAAVASYAVLARGQWWRHPVGIHLMCFMAAFAVVLDLNSVYLLTSGQVLAGRLPPGYAPDWFAWVRGGAFITLIPPVLAWRLLIILRPPKTKDTR